MDSGSGRGCGFRRGLGLGVWKGFRGQGRGLGFQDGAGIKEGAWESGIRLGSGRGLGVSKGGV